jgi:hypothetical protein
MFIRRVPLAGYRFCSVRTQKSKSAHAGFHSLRMSALTQCMTLTGSGCKRRPARANGTGIADVLSFTWFMNSISP